jgi:SAM-dependent methyltransferase
VCNRFTASGHGDALIDLDVVECEFCQLIQLHEMPPIAAIIPRLPWIRYREPEGHLNDMVGRLLGLRPEARTALGAGPFEQPLLSRLAAHGLTTSEIEPGFAATEGCHPYLESWQAGLNASRLAGISARLGTFDLVSCRYVIEHSAAPVAALGALKQLLAKNGLVVLEVPDSSKFLAARDYCFLWEEHSCYFVEETLRRMAEIAGFQVLALLRYPGALEDALVAILEVAPSQASPPAALGASSLFAAYRDGFASTRDMLRAKLNRAAGPGREQIALFGIGHQAIMFVNAFGIADEIALAVDDDPNKAGFFPPGFHGPVVGSERLLQDHRIQTCLFAVAPHIQEKVHSKLAPLAARGVEFRSIYAALDDFVLKERT